MIFTAPPRKCQSERFPVRSSRVGADELLTVDKYENFAVSTEVLGHLCAGLLIAAMEKLVIDVDLNPLFTVSFQIKLHLLS